MNVKTAKFVPLSELFDGFPEIYDAFNGVVGNFTITWGTNDFTLVRTKTFLGEIDGLDKEESIPPSQWSSFMERIKELPEDTLIDLES
jgi:hypothetical protein